MTAVLHDKAGAFCREHDLAERQPGCVRWMSLWSRDRVFYLTGHRDQWGRPIYREGWLH